MLAGALLLVAGYYTLSRGVHPGVIFLVRSHADLLRDFAPIAAMVMAFLLVFGLIGGWLLAGRMLAPLTHITDATRIAASGSLSHRIRLPGRRDEFRELADAFDAMLARLEAHVAEQQRFAANASHELRTPLAITQTLLDVARKDPNRDTGRRLAHAPAAADDESRAQRDRPQPPRAGLGVGDDERSAQGRDAHRREHRREARPAISCHTRGAVSARQQAHTRRSRGRRPRPGDREEHRPGARGNAHPQPAQRWRAPRDGAATHRSAERRLIRFRSAQRSKTGQWFAPARPWYHHAACRSS